MQAKLLKKPILLLVCLVCTTMFATAQEGRFNPEMRKELRTYHQENILPVLREQRLKFDAEITAADKKEIEQLRTKRAKLQEEQKALFAKYKGKRGTGQANLTEAQKGELMQLREQKKQLHRAATAIALKYRPQLESIKADLADDRSTWETDLKAIFQKYNPGLAEETNHSGRRRKHVARLAAYNRLTRPAHFILWDVNPDALIPAGTEQSLVFPNPTSSINTLNYTVSQSGNVRIRLLDAQGNTVRTLLDEAKQKGSYTLQVSLSELPNATYYYKIEAASGSETKRVLKR